MQPLRVPCTPDPHSRAFLQCDWTTWWVRPCSANIVWKQAASSSTSMKLGEKKNPSGKAMRQIHASPHSRSFCNMTDVVLPFTLGLSWWRIKWLLLWNCMILSTAVWCFVICHDFRLMNVSFKLDIMDRNLFFPVPHQHTNKGQLLV